jgi:hypothetical protein
MDLRRSTVMHRDRQWFAAAWFKLTSGDGRVRRVIRAAAAAHCHPAAGPAQPGSVFRNPPELCRATDRVLRSKRTRHRRGDRLA